MKQISDEKMKEMYGEHAEYATSPFNYQIGEEVRYRVQGTHDLKKGTILWGIDPRARTEKVKPLVSIEGVGTHRYLIGNPRTREGDVVEIQDIRGRVS